MAVRYGGVVEFASDPKMGRPLSEKDPIELMDLVNQHFDEVTRSDDTEAALREMYYRIKYRFENYIGNYMPHFVNDVLESAVLEGAESAKSWLAQDEDDFKTFLKKCVDRVQSREYRKTKRQKKAAQMDDFDMEDDKTPSPDFRIEEEEKAAQLEISKVVLGEELMKLDERDRLCVVKRHADGWTVEKIAELTGYSVSGVYKCLNRVLAQLRCSLTSRGIKLSAGAVASLLASHVVSEAGEGRLDRFIDSAPRFLRGETIPPDAISPMTQALYLNTGNVTTVGSTSWWMLGGVATIAIPVIGIAAWGVLFSQNQTPKPIAPEPEPARVPQVMASNQVSRGDVKPKKPQPGGFPDNPVSGQIHTVRVDALGITMDFCWSPGDDQTAGVWVQRTEMAQRQWKPIGTLLENPDPSDFKGDDLPVEMVDPNDVLAYVEKFKEVTGIPLRMPTVGEWVRAASAGFDPKTKADDFQKIDEIAWYNGNSFATQPVGLKKANQLNLYDTIGNVFELVDVGGNQYEIRGGSWSYDGNWCKPNGFSLFGGSIGKNSGTGFRLVYQPIVNESEN